MANGARFSVAIQAHPNRRKYIPYLHQQLGECPVAWSSIQRPQSWDVWLTWAKAARLHDSAARFHLIVQDDALIGRDFYPRLKALLSEHGEAPYCLFYRFKSRLTHEAMNAAGREAVGSFTFPRFQWCVATVLPTAWLPEIIEFGDAMGPEAPMGDDPRINRWLRGQGIETVYPIPSLVDHRSDRKTRSLLGRSNKGRVAWRFE